MDKEIINRLTTDQVKKTDLSKLDWFVYMQNNYACNELDNNYFVERGFVKTYSRVEGPDFEWTCINYKKDDFRKQYPFLGLHK